jgi:hypothetical protein
VSLSLGSRDTTVTVAAIYLRYWENGQSPKFQLAKNGHNLSVRAMFALLGSYLVAPDYKGHQRAGAAKNLQNRISGSRRPPQLPVGYPAGRGILPRREIQFFVQDRSKLSARTAKSEVLQ